MMRKSRRKTSELLRWKGGGRKVERNLWFTAVSGVLDISLEFIWVMIIIMKTIQTLSSICPSRVFLSNHHKWASSIKSVHIVITILLTKLFYHRYIVITIHLD